MKIGESERLRLRVFSKKDVDDVSHIWGNEEVMKYCLGVVGDRSSIARSIEFYINLQKEKKFSVYAVELLNSGKVIGACGFNPDDDDGIVELIYHYSEPSWGKGYGTEAARLAMDYISKRRKIKKVIASVSQENKDSEKILKKLGFTFIKMKWYDDSQAYEAYYEYELC